MFSTFHPNRWILYAVAFPIVIFELLMWQIGLYAIEQRYAPYATDAQASDLIYQIHKNRHSKVIDTSSWKTYRNEKYGFEFTYYPDSSNFEILSHYDNEQKEIPNSEFWLTDLTNLSRMIISPLGSTWPDLSKSNLKQTTTVGNFSAKRHVSVSANGIGWVVINEIPNKWFPRFAFQITTINARFGEKDLTKDEVAGWEAIISTFKFFEPKAN